MFFIGRTPSHTTRTSSFSAHSRTRCLNRIFGFSAVMIQIRFAQADSLRSQFATLEKDGGRGRHRKYYPYVFTEQGVSMLSAVLRSETAVMVSIKIINAFVEMRRFLQQNANVFTRLDSVERRQIVFEAETEKNFEKIFKALESGEPSKQGIFYNGQIYDAYTFACDLVRKARSRELEPKMRSTRVAVHQGSPVFRPLAEDAMSGFFDIEQQACSKSPEPLSPMLDGRNSFLLCFKRLFCIQLFIYKYLHQLL